MDQLVCFSSYSKIKLVSMPREVLSSLELKKQQPPYQVIIRKIYIISARFVRVAGENCAGYMFIWCIEITVHVMGFEL